MVDEFDTGIRERLRAAWQRAEAAPKFVWSPPRRSLYRRIIGNDPLGSWAIHLFIMLLIRPWLWPYVAWKLVEMRWKRAK